MFCRWSRILFPGNKKSVQRALPLHSSLFSLFSYFFLFRIRFCFLICLWQNLPHVCVCLCCLSVCVCVCCCPVATACCYCLGLISYRLYRFSLWATMRIVRADKINDNKSAGNKLKPNKKRANNQIQPETSWCFCRFCCHSCRCCFCCGCCMPLVQSTGCC